jgi:hypothetical protein
MTLAHLVGTLTTSRNLFKAALAFTSLVPSRALPADLPVRWLTVIAIIEILGLTALEGTVLNWTLILLLLAILVISGAVYFYLYEFTSFSKYVDRGSKWWRLWGNGLVNIKIMGGLWLKRGQNGFRRAKLFRSGIPRKCRIQPRRCVVTEIPRPRQITA